MTKTTVEHKNWPVLLTDEEVLENPPGLFYIDLDGHIWYVFSDGCGAAGGLTQLDSTDDYADGIEDIETDGIRQYRLVKKIRLIVEE